MYMLDPIIARTLMRTPVALKCRGMVHSNVWQQTDRQQLSNNGSSIMAILFQINAKFTLVTQR